MYSTWRISVLSGLATEDMLPWRDRILQLGDVQVNKSSRMGLVMKKGEPTLITKCTVTVDGQEGFGMSMGYDIDRAEILALIDALFRCTEEKWEKVQMDFRFWIEDWALEQEEAEEVPFRLIQRTEIDWEIIDEWEDQ
ncbi:MAG TPA: hypothetical protein DDY49_06635 [Paenibacillaceae bacterium]|nr:hypothetical protein [Paenibacillaceae bacterium]